MFLKKTGSKYFSRFRKTLYRNLDPAEFAIKFKGVRPQTLAWLLCEAKPEYAAAVNSLLVVPPDRSEFDFMTNKALASTDIASSGISEFIPVLNTGSRHI